jgi:capsular polysaccharide biosynthesis protein
MYKPPSTFKEHLELFASHGVIVSPHGAGLMNTLFLVPGSSVVELYPYHLHHNLYPLMAANMQIGHYPVYSYNGTDMWRRDEVCVCACVRVLCVTMFLVVF